MNYIWEIKRPGYSHFVIADENRHHAALVLARGRQYEPGHERDPEYDTHFLGWGSEGALQDYYLKESEFVRLGETQAAMGVVSLYYGRVKRLVPGRRS